MKTEDTHPCFTQLHLRSNYDVTFAPEIVMKSILIGRNVSSELYILYRMEQFSNLYGVPYTNIVKTHGPCISNIADTHELTWCLKCDKWIIRPRTT